MKNDQAHLFHDYDDVDLDVVWRTAQNDLPLLIASLEAYFAKMPQQGPGQPPQPP